MSIQAKILLENGMEFVGKSFGFPKSTAGEVVFNTAMTGYPESLTDPSYKGQILVSTYPLIGNYGVPNHLYENGLPTTFESDCIQIAALVVSDYSFEHSHWNAEKSLAQWLEENQIPGIYGIDTRELTKVLRESGCMLGKIVINDEGVAWYDPNKDNLVDQVSIKEKQVYGTGKNKIMLVDCGVKANIIRSLLKYDTTVIRVPWNYDFTHEDYDGLFISNGPGDPSLCEETIAHIKTAINDDKPIFGICLGSQLLGIASGATTYKLKYGHRSHNQPVQEFGTNKCYITSQNHGFAVDHSKLTNDWEPYFLNLNDGTCEGIRHKSKPIFATQFHPEANGGPTDTRFLFEKFINIVEQHKHNK